MLITSNKNQVDGLVKASSTADLPVPIQSAKIAAPEYKGVAVDTRWLPRTNLLTHLEGSSWYVDYYSQILDTDSPLSGQQLSLSAVNQQYRKITGMEMKVTSPLSTEQDEDTKSMKMLGTSMLYPFLIPNEGDMFVVDLGQGVRGVLRVVRSRKMSIYKEACYEIDYSLDTDDQDKQDDLESKVVEALFFHKDYLNMGKNPLLLQDNHQALLEVGDVFASTINQYFKKFFSSEFKTLMVPAQERTVYDPFLVNFLLTQFNSDEAMELKFVRKLFVEDVPAMKADSLWTAIRERDISYLNVAFKRSGLLNTRCFSSDPVMNGIRYTGISYSIYPIDPTLSVDQMLIDTAMLLAPVELAPSPAMEGSLNQMVRALNLRNLGSTADTIKLVTVDDFYVLSEDFYLDAPTGQSELEKIVWQYLKGQPVDYKVLVETAKLHTRWPMLEQFYYVPLLLVMMKDLIQGGGGV